MDYMQPNAAQTRFASERLVLEQLVATMKKGDGSIRITLWAKKTSLGLTKRKIQKPHP